MRFIATVVGVGKRVTGTSAKTYRVYDFTPVSITYEDPYGGFKGVRAETVNVDQTHLSGAPVAVGDAIELVAHTQNGRIYVDAIL